MGRQRHRSEGNGRGLTRSQPDDRDSAPPGRSESSTGGGGDRSNQIVSPPPKPSVGAAGGPIGVYRPEDRLTSPALRRPAGDITSPRTGSSSLPCPRRPHELRGSTIPSRRSFFGCAPGAQRVNSATRTFIPSLDTKISSILDHTLVIRPAAANILPAVVFTGGRNRRTQLALGGPLRGR
jgi:hypothetical protein